MSNLNELRDKAYQCAVAHGWHEKDLSDEHFLCLVISELMEAVEADRKGKYADIDKFTRYYNSLIYETYEKRAFMVAYEKYIKGSVNEELADACIRIFDLAGLRKINLSDIPFPIYNSDDHKNNRKSLTFTEWVYDVTCFISGFNKNNYPIEYSFIDTLEEICCKAELIGFDILWHIDHKMRYNELRPYKHGGRTY